MNAVRARRILACAAATAAVAMYAPTAGAASPYGALKQLSGPDPLPTSSQPNHCGSAAGTPYDRHNWEFDPTVVVNPTNPNNIVAAWIQDWSDAIAVAYSTDGGTSWKEVVPGTTICTPGGLSAYDNGASDPSLAFAPPTPGRPQGTVYLMSWVLGQNGAIQADLVNESFDGGRTWTAPTVVNAVAAPFALDGANIAVDPNNPLHAWVTWVRITGPALATFDEVSATTDGGQSWSAPSPVVGAGTVTPGEILPLPDGTLLDVYGDLTPQPGGAVDYCAHGPQSIDVSRSLDGGATWVPAGSVAPVANPTAYSAFSATVAPDSSVDVTWQYDAGTPVAPKTVVMLARSTDDGLTWTQNQVAVIDGHPPMAGNSRFGFPHPQTGNDTVDPLIPTLPGSRCINTTMAPSVAATNDTIAVLWDDHRNDIPANNPPKRTDVWLAASSDGGATWDADQHVAGPFDQTQAPSFDGGLPGQPENALPGSMTPPGYVGDGQGLTVSGDSFDAVVTLAAPMPGANFTLKDPPTDIFFTRIR